MKTNPDSIKRFKYTMPINQDIYYIYNKWLLNRYIFCIGIAITMRNNHVTYVLRLTLRY